MKKSLGLLAGVALMASATIGPASSAVAASSKAPITIAFMGVETGVYATPGRNNDISMAVKQINAEGGVDGHRVQYVAYDANITPQAAVTATQKALGNKPTAFIGYNVDDQIQATAQLLKQSGIPVLTQANGPASGSPAVHVPNLYTTVPSIITSIQASTSYAYSKYHPTSVGIFHTDDTASNEDAAAAQSLLRKLGVKNFTVRSASDQATDTTQQALAMKGDDVVFEYGFPTVEANVTTALSQNGITAPIIADQSGNFVAAYGLNKPAELTKYSFTPFCYPPVLPTKQAKAYVAAYSAAYPGQSLQTSTPYIYDAVEFLAAAIKADGGNLSPSAINKKLSAITYTGACGTYQADSNHNLIRQVVLVSYADGINPGTLAATFHLGPVPSPYFKGA